MEIKLNGEIINYRPNPSKKSKTIKLTINTTGSVVLTFPMRMDVQEAEKFLIAKSGWILKKLRYLAKKEVLMPANIHHKDEKIYKQQAKSLILQKIDYFNRFYKFPINNITIRNKKTSWGSCSKKGNLSFNYKIIFLPAELIDYIVVHELCHLKEFNHSKKFWSLVEETQPNFLALRKRLKNVI